MAFRMGTLFSPELLLADENQKSSAPKLLDLILDGRLAFQTHMDSIDNGVARTL